jgi:diguanylate cyclase (GGDEF)-like protein
MTDQLRLLIIEDSPAEQVLIDALLADFPSIHRCFVDTLGDAQRAIDELTPDVVLLDLQLPDAHGLDSVTRLQVRNPDLPIVVRSGFGADDLLVAREAVGLGAQDFIGKGKLEGDDLYRVLQLARARKSRETAELGAAVRDPLTGLPRLPLIEERLQRSLARRQRNGGQLALLHLDIDGFTTLEAEVGRDLAEPRLVDIAVTLRGQLRETDSLARLDGAAFLALVDGMKHASDAYVVARKLLAVIRQRRDDAAAPTRLRLSIGVAPWPGRPTDFASECARAESAMYEARGRGGDCYASAVDLAVAAA